MKNLSILGAKKGKRGWNETQKNFNSTPKLFKETKRIKISSGDAIPPAKIL